MVDKLVRLTSEQRSNFVAYLDGELEEPQAREIEQLLTQNEVARHDMESLAAAWELLDELPRVNAPENFSQKTMATLAMEGQHTSLQEQPWYLTTRYYTRMVIGWILVLACGAGGYLAARTLPPSPNDALINNYPLLRNLDHYQEIGSSDFLDKLQRSAEWSRRHLRPLSRQGGRR